ASLAATLALTGPWGTFVRARARDAEAVFTAIDTGVAPIRPMLHRAAAPAAHPLTLLYASHHPLYLDELGRLGGLDVDVVSPAEVEAEVRGRWLERDADRTRHFYICGVGNVVPRLRDLLRSGGYVRRAVQ